MSVTVQNSAKINTASGGSIHKAEKSPTALAGYIVTDNHYGTYTIYGKNAAGQQTDLQEACTITITSADPTTIEVIKTTVDSFKAVPKKAGSVNLTATITWKNAANPTNVLTLPFTVLGDPATKLQETLGTALFVS